MDFEQNDLNLLYVEQIANVHAESHFREYNSKNSGKSQTAKLCAISYFYERNSQTRNFFFLLNIITKYSTFTSAHFPRSSFFKFAQMHKSTYIPWIFLHTTCMFPAYLNHAANVRRSTRFTNIIGICLIFLHCISLFFIPLYIFAYSRET